MTRQTKTVSLRDVLLEGLSSYTDKDYLRARALEYLVDGDNDAAHVLATIISNHARVANSAENLGVQKFGLVWWPATNRELERQCLMAISRITSANKKLLHRQLIRRCKGAYEGRQVSLYRPDEFGITSRFSSLLKNQMAFQAIAIGILRSS